MGKHKRRPKAKPKPPKVRVGHCENPACREKEPLRTITVQVDGKAQGRSVHLCRSCTAMTLVRFGDHPRHGGWR